MRKLTRKELRNIIRETVTDVVKEGIPRTYDRSESGRRGGKVHVRVFPSGYGTFGNFTVSGTIQGQDIFIMSQDIYDGKMVDIQKWKYAQDSFLASTLAKSGYSDLAKIADIGGVVIHVDVEPEAPRS